MKYTENRIDSWAFCQYNAYPGKAPASGGITQSVLNAVSIINRCSWQSAYEDLLAVAQELGVMPGDTHCVKALLAKHNFFLQPKVKESVSIEDFCRVMDAKCHDGQIAILQVESRRFGSELLAVVPNEYAKVIGKRNRFGQYLCVGSEYPANNQIQEVWVKWKDGKDHSPVKRRKGRSLGTPSPRNIPDTEYFHYHHVNPVGRYVGDCSVRALAAACNVSWCEAMDKLAKSTDYSTTAFNVEPFINKALEAEGFIRHNPITSDGKLLTGKEFCQEVTARYHKGERIFAYVGNNHAVAVLPVDDGKTIRYKIMDSWNSSDRKIGTYFVKEVSDRTAKVALANELKRGSKVVHPVFGEGTIKGTSHDGWLVILFGSAGQRLIDTKWVLHNCRRVA